MIIASIKIAFYYMRTVRLASLPLHEWWNPFSLPNDELHLAPARRVHKDGNQLWVARAKDAMRPDGNSEETRLFITSLEH